MESRDHIVAAAKLRVVRAGEACETDREARDYGTASIDIDGLVSSRLVTGTFAVSLLVHRSGRELQGRLEPDPRNKRSTVPQATVCSELIAMVWSGLGPVSSSRTFIPSVHAITWG